MSSPHPIIISPEAGSDDQTLEMYMVSSDSSAGADNCITPPLFSSPSASPTSTSRCSTPPLFSSPDSASLHPSSTSTPNPSATPPLFSSPSSYNPSPSLEFDYIPPSPPAIHSFKPLFSSACYSAYYSTLIEPSCFIVSPPPEPSPISISSSAEFHVAYSADSATNATPHAPAHDDASHSSVYSSPKKSPDQSYLSLSFHSPEKSSESLDFGDLDC